jgi:hypothetical protein
MRSAACIEVAADGTHPGAQAGVQQVGRAQRPGLLEHQGQQNSKKTHGCDDIAGPVAKLN